MKKINSLLLMGIFMISAIAVSAQAKLKSGEASVLKGQTIVNLQFDYAKMSVGKYSNEQDYVTNGIADRNKKKTGSGDEWGKQWVGDRQDKFQPMFEKNLNERTGQFGITFKEGARDAKYTLICRTTFTEPGFNIGITRQRAWIRMEIDLVETANPGTILATIEMKKEESLSMAGYDFDTGSRIQSCYDRAGEHLGVFFIKNVLK